MSTHNTPPSQQSAGGVLLASLLLPGLATLAVMGPTPAAAESAPEKSTIAVKYGSYSDSQPGWERVKATAPQIYVQVPIAGEWSIEASGVVDNVSGATPYAHTQKSGASSGGKMGMSDERKAGDVKITRYMARSAISASVAYSKENDYTSTALGLEARWSSDNNNRTWTLGFGAASDSIDNTASGINTAINEHKNTQEFMGGITQVLTPTDIVQLNFTRGVGSGYFNDPYKSYDLRPSQRDTWIALARWNHYLEPFDASLRTSYRHYSDTFGVQSHTVGLDWVQPVGKVAITSGVRYYSQQAANFYFDPVLNAQGQYDGFGALMRAASLKDYKSADQRLAAFGAVTLSMKIAYTVTPDTVVDFKIETYRQSADLYLGGTGSPGLAPFNAQFVQIGLTRRF
ncbi:MAG: DUF3570 domain-containing protein [Rhodoferax sp.]|nr:DUF3570 domain-containing protein [Rhodoferax sp.]